MRAVIYCRVSTEEQVKNMSLPTQEKACRDYCARQGYVVGDDDLFIDRGESAKTTDRPEFLRMVAHCRAHKGRIHAVVVYALTRFSRNTADHFAIASLLRGFGVMLRSVTEPFDDSPFGRAMEGMLAVMAQLDNDVKSDLTIRRMKAAIQRGRWVWGAPLGYRKKNDRALPSLVPDPDVAPLVQRAFAIAAAGEYSGRALWTHLRALGLKGQAGAPLVRSRFLAMLKNPIYMGVIQVAGWEGEAQRGDFDPLVSPELFRAVQQRIAGARTNPGRRHRNHPDFPLRRFVRCGRCERPLTGSWSRGRSKAYAHYHCLAGCTRVSKLALEDAFVQLVERLTPAPEYVCYVRAVALDLWREQAATDRQQRAQLQACLTKIDGQLGTLDQAYIYDRRIDVDTYQRERGALRERQTVLRLELSEALISESELEGLLDFAEHALRHASAFWTAAATTDEKIAIQSTLFPEGLVWQPTSRSAGRFQSARDASPAGAFLEPRSVFTFYEMQPSGAQSRGEVGPPGIEPGTP